MLTHASGVGEGGCAVLIRRGIRSYLFFCLVIRTLHAATGWQHSAAHGCPTAGCGHVQGEGKRTVCAPLHLAGCGGADYILKIASQIWMSRLVRFKILRVVALLMGRATV